MKICVLCEDSKVDLARENIKKIDIFGEATAISPIVAKIKENLKIPNTEGHLRIPLSSSGEAPATHWFCFMNVGEESYQKIKSIQEHSVIEESSPKEFLEKWNLKIIKSLPLS